MDTMYLGTEDVKRLLLRLLPPSICAQLVTMLYNLVDRIYIGRLPEGEWSIAAIGIITPVVTIITAVTALLGNGGAPLCAIRLGRGDVDGAEKVLGSSFTMLLLSSVGIMAVVLHFLTPILILFGATDQTMADARAYLQTYVMGTTFIQIAVGINPYINTQGFTRVGMCSVLTGCILNLVLDPVFIFWLKMGVRGAALATVISQFASAVFALGFLFSSKSILHIRPRYLTPEPRIVLDIMKMGFSPFVMKLTGGLLLMNFNRQLLRFGGDLAVSAMSVLTSVWNFLELPSHGITDGAQPILGYNLGAKKYARVRETFRVELMVNTVYCLAFYLLVLAMPELFVRMFNSSPALMEMAVPMMKIYLFGAVVFGAFMTCQQTYLALGFPKYSFLFACVRKIVILIPLIYLLPYLLRQKVYAVVLAEPIADIVSTILNCVFFWKFYQKVLPAEEFPSVEETI